MVRATAPPRPALPLPLPRPAPPHYSHAGSRTRPALPSSTCCVGVWAWLCVGVPLLLILVHLSPVELSRAARALSTDSRRRLNGLGFSCNPRPATVTSNTHHAHAGDLLTPPGTRTPTPRRPSPPSRHHSRPRHSLPHPKSLTYPSIPQVIVIPSIVYFYPFLSSVTSLPSLPHAHLTHTRLCVSPNACVNPATMSRLACDSPVPVSLSLGTFHCLSHIHSSVRVVALFCVQALQRVQSLVLRVFGSPKVCVTLALSQESASFLCSSSNVCVALVALRPKVSVA